jgi:hypothetical protein
MKTKPKEGAMNIRNAAGLIVAGCLLALGAPARGDDAQPAQDPLKAIEIQRKQLELDKQRAELHFNNELRNIELQKKRFELERERQAPPPPAMREGHPAMGCPAMGCKGRWHGRQHCWMACAGLLAFCGIIHILLTVWVYGDIRQRKTGSGLWLVVTLLTGLVGAAVYALVRLGDKPAAAP